MIIFIDTRLRADFSLFKVYSIKVAWSDGTINIVYRRYSEVLQLEVKATCMDYCHYILCPEFSIFLSFTLLILFANEANMLKVGFLFEYCPR